MIANIISTANSPGKAQNCWKNC